MRLLFAVFLASMVALLWAAVSIARHIRRQGARAERQGARPERQASGVGIGERPQGRVEAARRP
jgi:hypothetical protein